MRHIFLIIACMALAVPAYAARSKVVVTVETAFGSIPASFTEALAIANWEQIDVLNDSDCDITLQFPDIASDPENLVPAGTSDTIDVPRGGYIASAVNYKYVSGETCAAGSVQIRGIR